MRRISKIAKELDTEQFPGVRQSLRMPRSSYQLLQSRADTFVTITTPIKATFVERGLPADSTSNCKMRSMYSSWRPSAKAPAAPSAFRAPLAWTSRDAPDVN
jgi:hypothetical protein